MEKLIFRIEAKNNFLSNQIFLVDIDRFHSWHAIPKLFSVYFAFTHIYHSEHKRKRRKRERSTQSSLPACLHCGVVWNLLLKWHQRHCQWIFTFLQIHTQNVPQLFEISIQFSLHSASELFKTVQHNCKSNIYCRDVTWLYN